MEDHEEEEKASNIDSSTRSNSQILRIALQLAWQVFQLIIFFLFQIMSATTKIIEYSYIQLGCA